MELNFNFIFLIIQIIFYLYSIFNLSSKDGCYFQKIVLFKITEANNILVNGKDIGICKRGYTSFITGPSDNLYDLIDALNINCKNIKELPTLKFVLDGIHYDLDAHDYIMKIDSYGKEVNKFIIQLSIAYGFFTSTESFLEMDGDCECAGTFIPLDIPFPFGPAWVFGDTLLSKYYSVQDRDNVRVDLQDLNDHIFLNKNLFIILFKQNCQSCNKWFHKTMEQIQTTIRIKIKFNAFQT